MKYHVMKFDSYHAEDPVRILTFWESRLPCKEVRSGRMDVFIGYPVKQMESYRIPVHKIVFQQQN